MSPEIRRNLIVDTGFWLALFDPRDERFHDARGKARYIDSLRVLFPWPTLYETLGTRFVKNKTGLVQFEAILRHPNVTYIDDTQYRDRAVDATLQGARLGKRAISLCDMLIRLLIEDTDLKVGALLTFTAKDFHDVCGRVRVEIL